MLNRISTKLTIKLLRRINQTDYSYDVYVYGIEIILSTLVEIAVILSLATLFSEILEGVLFIGTFFSLRIFSGGYHAETYQKCFLVTTGAFLCVQIITKIACDLHLEIAIQILLLIAGAYIIFYAPVLNKNQPISKLKEIKNGKMASIITLFQITFIFRIINYNRRLFFISSFTVCLVAAFMFFTNMNIKKGEKVNGMDCEID